MKTLVRAIMALAIAVGLAGAAYAERTPPGSFLKQRAVSVKALAQQVRKDPVARKRFARHFSIPEATVADRFEKTLQMKTIKTPLRTTMWYVSKNNTVQKKTKLLPKGTVVFADKAGKPILAWSCANPMAPRLSNPQAPPTTVTTAPPDEEIVKPFTETVTGAAVTSTPEIVSPVVVPALGAPTLEAVTLPAIAAPPVLASSSGLGALGALAAAGSLAGFSGGGKSTPTPPVPEPPASMVLALGTMLMGGAAYWRARLRRR